MSTDTGQSLRALVTSDAMRKQFALALPKALPIDRFLRVLVTTLARTPGLAECDRQTVLAGAMTAAQLGLEIDPALGRAYLLPYRRSKNGPPQAQLIIGYKGYVDLAYRSGMLAGLQAEAVYAADHFLYRLGLSPQLEHVPSDADDRGPLKYAYAVATLANGGSAWRVLNRAQVERRRSSSQSARSSYSPWQTHPEEMWRKSAIRALASILPLSPELRLATVADGAICSGPTDASSTSALGLQYGDALTMAQPEDEAPDDSTDAPQQLPSPAATSPTPKANPFARQEAQT